MKIRPQVLTLGLAVTCLAGLALYLGAEMVATTIAGGIMVVLGKLAEKD